jgi:hypothetical protein
VTVRRVQQTPVLSTLDSAMLGAPSVRLEIATGAAALWLLRTADTVLVVGLVRDQTRAWKDEVVVSLHLAGPAASVPQHEDFQWALRRTLDSSVVYRGRGNRWEPPRSDPDWRLGPDHSGGGWTVEAREVTGGWWLMLRLEGPWLDRSSRFAVRVRDSESPDWASWPPGKAHPSEVEASPALWGLVRE